MTGRSTRPCSGCDQELVIASSLSAEVLHFIPDLQRKSSAGGRSTRHELGLQRPVAEPVAGLQLAAVVSEAQLEGRGVGGRRVHDPIVPIETSSRDQDLVDRSVNYS